MQRNERDAMFFHHHQNSMNKQAQEQQVVDPRMQKKRPGRF